jgi:hypothetical protein
MQPLEIGAAAAYEAYRQIKYGQNVYNFLYTDFERQREALHAMAIAEGVCHQSMAFSHDSRDLSLLVFTAVRLWQDTGRAVDQYGLQAACDAAAGTASNISMERGLEDPYGMGYGGDGFRSRRNSFGAFPPGYAGSGGFGGSVYGGDSPLLGGRSIPGSPIGPGPIPLAGSYSGIGGGVPYANSLSPGGIGMPMSGMPMSYGGSYGGGYAGSYGSPGYDPLGMQAGGYPYGGYASMPGTPATMLIQPAEEHHHGHGHRHRHHHRHHRRHRSHDRY